MSNRIVCYKPYVDEFTTVLLYTGDDKKVKGFFYGAVYSVMLGQWVSKRAGVDAL
jgi:hypothetical protein